MNVEQMSKQAQSQANLKKKKKGFQPNHLSHNI